MKRHSDGQTVDPWRGPKPVISNRRTRRVWSSIRVLLVSDVARLHIGYMESCGRHTDGSAAVDCGGVITNHPRLQINATRSVWRSNQHCAADCINGHSGPGPSKWRSACWFNGDNADSDTTKWSIYIRLLLPVLYSHVALLPSVTLCCYR